MANINWQNLPSETTPINSTNLNVMSAGLLNVSNEADDTYRVNLLSSKNMLKLPDIASTTTTTGLTYSVSNGVLTISGTASANTTIVLASDLNINIPDKTAYRISVNKTGTTTATGSNLQFLLRDSSNTILGYVNNIASASQTSNSFQNAGLINNAIFVIISGVQLTNAQFTFQVEEGSTATTYEPFTQNSMIVDGTKFTDTINVGSLVDNRNRVNLLETKNLFDKNNIIYYANNNNGFDGIAGTSTTRERTNSIELTKYNIKTNTTYVISGLPTGWILLGVGTFTSPSSQNINASSVNSNNGTFTITDNNIKYIYFLFKNDISTSVATSLFENASIQIEEGETATTYSPFISNQIVVDNEKYSDTLNVGASVDSRSKVNVLKSKNIVQTSNIYMQQGLKSEDGTMASAASRVTIYKVPIKPNTQYTLSCASGYQIGNVFQYNSSGTYTSTAESNFATSKQYTSTSTTYYISFVLKNSDNTTIPTSEISNIKVQIEEGSTATTYEPFIQNKIVVDNEKYSDTLNVGASLDSRSRVNVLHSKNLTDGIWENGGWSNTGEKADSPSFMRTANPIYVKPNTTYTLKISQSNNQIVVYYYSASAYINLAFVQNTDTYTFTTPANCVKINFRLSGQSLSLANTMLNEGSTALPYEQYLTPSINVDGEMLVSKNVYSTGEVVIGEWLGKPLYRQVINIGALTNASLKTTAHGISNVDIVYKVSGITYDSGYNFFPLPFSSKVANESISLFANRTNIYTNCGTDRTSFTTTYITLEYTKTTDV